MRNWRIHLIRRHYTQYHLPQASDNRAMGDFVLAAKDGYAFGQDATGVDLIVANPNPTAGAHGFLSTNAQMNALFVASGSGIKAGKEFTTIENIEVAPTIARLLGVSLENASGRVLDEILVDTK